MSAPSATFNPEFFKSSPFGFFISNPEGRYLFANAALADMLGYDTPEELIETITGIATQVYANPEERQEFMRLMLAHGKVVDHECQFKRKDGAIIWVSRSVQAVFDDQDNVVQYQGINTDITERKQSEERARENEHFSHKLPQTVPIPVFYKDRNGRYQGVNKAFEAFFGKSKDELVGKTVFDINPPELARIYHAKDTELFDKPGTQVYDAQVKDAHGNMHDVTFHKATLVDRQGTVAGLIGAVLDVTEHKQKDQQLRESEERFRLLIENMAEGIVLKDAEDRYVHWNQTASDIFGIGIDGMRGQTTKDFKRRIIREDGSPFPLQEMPSLLTLRTGEPCENVVMGIMRGPQDTVWVKANTRPIFIEGDENPSGVVISFSDITALKRASTELLKNKWAIDSSINALALADLDGSLTYVNQAFLDLWGYQHPDEVCGKQATLFWQSEQDPAAVMESLRNQGGWRGMMAARRQDGTLFDAEVSASMVLDDAGKPLCMQASFVDITERRQSEERIQHLNAVLQAYIRVNEIIFNAREQRRLLEDICQALTSTRGYHNAWIMLLNEDREVTDWAQTGLGDAFQVLLSSFRQGKMSSCAGNALNSPLPQIVTDPQEKCKDCPLAGSYSGRAGFAVRLEVGDRTIGLLAVSVPKKMAHDAGEHELFMNLAGAIALGVQRIRLEEIRRGQQKRLQNFERIISRVNDPMSLIDKNYRYVVVNDAYLRTFKKQRHEIEGRTVEDLLGQDVFVHHVKPRLDLALAGQEIVYEECFPGTDGSPRHRIMSYYSVRDQENGFAHVVSRAVDITERKAAEEEIKNINQQLQKAVAEKDMLFSIVAHDLKSPMSGLLAATEMLANQADIFSEKELRLLSTELHKSARNTFALLEDLLQWSRMSQGGIDYAPGPCSLKELINMSLYLAQDEAKRKDIDIHGDISQGLAVLVDQPMINTVIRNVLFNAIKFTRRGGEIVIKARQEGQTVTVAIQDTGIGMNEQMLSSVFSLEKAKRQLGTKGEKGTGLGLVLCKQFIEQHDEQIWVESEPGKGTTVFFTLSAA